MALVFITSTMLSTRLLTDKFSLSSVTASSLSTLCFCVVGDQLYAAQLVGQDYKPLIFCASFAGMSSSSKITKFTIAPISLALYVLYLGRGILPLPVGGTLGFIAFLAVIACNYLKDTIAYGKIDS